MNFLLAILSGILLILGWPPIGFTPLLFAAFVPLLWIEYKISSDKKNYGRFAFFGYAFLAMLIWNVGTSYWIWNATIGGAIAAFLINSLLMAFTLHLFHISHIRFFNKKAYLFLLPIYWAGFEYFHFDWDLSFPALTLGNGFANIPKWVQWYEYTGVLGGSIFLLVCNIFIFIWAKSVVEKAAKKTKVRLAILVTLICLLPIFISVSMYNRYQEKGDKINVVIVQPNIDPYAEQYEILPLEAVTKMIDLAAIKCTEKTRLIVTPESMIQEYAWDEEIPNLASVKKIQSFLQEYPNICLLADISSQSIALPEEANDPSVRHAYDNLYYRFHNTAILIEQENCTQKYYKSKLTPGVEIMPFSRYLPFIKKLALDFGGTIGGLGIDKEQRVFRAFNDTVSIAPIICYESIFPDHVSSFVRNGASLLCIITNEGWWGNTAGYKQLAAYARLRAIENRRCVARSANTGRSCFINQRGDISETTNYWVPAVISKNVQTNSELTIYSRFGNIIGRVCLPASLFLILLVLLYGYFFPKFRTSIK